MARLPSFGGFFQMAARNEFANCACRRAEADASNKASIPRSKKKFVSPGVGAMLADGEQNLFVRQCGVRKFALPCPARPFLGCGLEPAFAPRPFNTVAQLPPVFVRFATQADSLPLVFAQP